MFGRDRGKSMVLERSQKPMQEWQCEQPRWSEDGMVPTIEAYRPGWNAQV